jgi:hypothetical protein
MDTITFDAVTRLFGSGTTRREALRRLMAGAAALTAGGALLPVEAAAGRKKRRKNKNKKMKKKMKSPPAPAGDPAPPPPPPSPPLNPCDDKNWCVDRSQTCGPEGGYGKCLVEAGGGNICAEILFQAASCTDCAPANCTNCSCVLAAGGGDRCNNGPTGHDFICVRAV